MPAGKPRKWRQAKVLRRMRGPKLRGTGHRLQDYRLTRPEALADTIETLKRMHELELGKINEWFAELKGVAKGHEGQKYVPKRNVKTGRVEWVKRPPIDMKMLQRRLSDWLETGRKVQVLQKTQRRLAIRRRKLEEGKKP